MSETDIDEVLDLIGFGCTQFLMVFTCAMITIYMNNEIMGIGLLSVPMSCDLKINDLQISLLSTAAIVGVIISSIYSGYRTDRVGRRAMILQSLFLGLISAIISAVMPEFYSLLFFRFLTGLFLSGAGINHLTYLTEYTKISLRPRMVNSMSYFVAFCSMYVPVMASLMKPLNYVMWEFGSYKWFVWRFSLLSNCLPGIAAFCGMCYLPETAKFLLAVNDHDGAYRELDRLCLRNRKRDLKSFGVTSISQPSMQDRPRKSKYGAVRMYNETRTVLSPPYLLPVLQVTIILSGFSAVGNGFGLWFTKMRHYMSTEGSTLCDALDFCKQQNDSSENYYCDVKPINYRDGVILNFSVFCCCIFAAALLVFLSRRTVLTSFAFTATLLGLSLNFLSIKVLQLIAQVLFIAMSASCISLAGSTLVDIMPTHLRGSAAAVAFMFSRLAIVVTSILLGQMMCDYCILFLNFLVDFLFLVAILSFILPVK